MSHPAQVKFCKQVKKKFPQFFKRKLVIDAGSLDINGSNRRFFDKCFYIGIDIVAGRNVDLVGLVHEQIEPFNNLPDVVISTEMLEHDKYWKETLGAMYRCLIQGGLMLITCAGEGRPEHGTTENHAWCSPGTNDYYLNVTNEMFASVLKPEMFRTYYLSQNSEAKDLQFYGIKK